MLLEGATLVIHSRSDQEPLLKQHGERTTGGKRQQAQWQPAGRRWAWVMRTDRCRAFTVQRDDGGILERNRGTAVGGRARSNFPARRERQGTHGRKSPYAVGTQSIQHGHLYKRV